MWFETKYHVRTRMGMYLVPYRLFARKIFDTYIGLRNQKNIFQLAFLSEILGYNKWYQNGFGSWPI